MPSWPFRTLLLASACVLPGAAWAACSTTANAPAKDGGFGVLNGQIYTPDGKLFVARGINVMGFNLSDALKAPSTFPGLNFIRLPIYSYNSPSELQPIINQLTSQGVVVELEDHTASDGSVSGGSSGTVFTGQRLQQELDWYSSVAGAFKNNPYVWFGTNNEPPEAGGSLSQWHQQTYQAIRSAGNNNPIMIDPWGAYLTQGLDPSVYKGMTNVLWDEHYYGWAAGYSTDQNTVNQALAKQIADANAIQSADGKMPIIVGEYGNSTTGYGIDANGDQVVQAVRQAAESGATSGSAAWAWGTGNPGDGLLNGDGSLSSYGQLVEQTVGSGAAPGCPASPIATTADLTSSDQQAVQQAQQISDQATQDLQATLNGAPPAVGDGLSVDQVAELAAGYGNADLRTPGPTGTSPPPPPVSGPATALDASQDYGVIASAEGNHIIAVSGQGSTVTATGGTQTVTVGSAGNAVTLGPYDDTVTVQSQGNTIDTGGGSNTVTLVYGHPSDVVNQDAAAVAPLGSVGNVFLAPPPGTGTMTIVGTLAQNDRIDLTKALAGTTWNHDPNTMWQYLNARASPGGCELLVGNTVVVKLINGSPSGNIGPFLAAH